MKLSLAFLFLLFAHSGIGQSYLKDHEGYKRIRSRFQLIDTVWRDTTTEQITLRYIVYENMYDKGIIDDTIYIRAARSQVQRFARAFFSDGKLYSIHSHHFWIVRRTEDCIGDSYIYQQAGAW